MREEFRRALRTVIRSRLVTFPAIALLAITGGATVAASVVLDSVLLRAVPYRDSHELVDIVTVEHVEQLLGRRTAFLGVNSGQALTEVRSMSALFDETAGYRVPHDALIERDGILERGSVGRLAPGLMGVLGVAPVIGRDFREADVDQGNAAIIGETYWRRAFGGSASALGRTLIINARQYEVVGVSPAALRFGVGGATDVLSGAGVWLPLDEEDGSPVPLAARLRDGLDVATAQRELNARVQSLAAQGSSAWRRDTLELRPFGSLEPSPPRDALLAIWGASIAVLLLGCVNVANLMLYRSLVSEHITRTHAILGARPWQLARGTLIEGLMLSIASFPVAAAICYALLKGLRSVAPVIGGTWLYSIATPSFDGRALSLLSLVTFAIGIGVAAVPAHRASRVAGLPRPLAYVVGASRADRRVARGLQAVQVALTVVLVSASVAMTWRLIELKSADLGYDASRLSYVSIARVSDDEVQQRLVMEALKDRVEATPGVDGAVIANDPATGYRMETVRRAGIAPTSASTAVYLVPSDYLEVAGIPVQLGRPDPAVSPQAVISRSLANELWPDDDPIGKDVLLASGRYLVTAVVDDIKLSTHPRVRRDFQLYLLVPESGANTVLFHTVGRPGEQTSTTSIRRSVDARLEVTRAGIVSDLYERHMIPIRFGATIAGGVAVAGLVIAMTGLAALLSFSMHRRRAELAIRMALGANTKDLLRIVIAEAISPVILGVLAGVPISMMLMAALSLTVLVDSSVSPSSVVPVALLLVFLSAVAATAPACQVASLSGRARLADE